MCEQAILAELLRLDLFDNSVAEGIAKYAISNGIDSLSVKQRAVIDPYFSMECAGYDVHGVGEEGHDLSGERLLHALQNYEMNEHQVVCEECSEEESFYQYKYDKLMDE
ncbi:hypothetical protein ACVPAH_004167 [Providencia stuartii]